jgi:hypothetical protein
MKSQFEIKKSYDEKQSGMFGVKPKSANFPPPQEIAENIIKNHGGSYSPAPQKHDNIHALYEHLHNRHDTKKTNEQELKTMTAIHDWSKSKEGTKYPDIVSNYPDFYMADDFDKLKRQHVKKSFTIKKLRRDRISMDEPESSPRYGRDFGRDYLGSFSFRQKESKKKFTTGQKVSGVWEGHVTSTRELGGGEDVDYGVCFDTIKVN